jgi:hypothetical protein
MTDSLAHQGDDLAAHLNRGTNTAYSDNTLEAVIAAKLGMPAPEDPDALPVDDNGNPIPDRAVDVFQGTGNTIGTPAFGDPLLHEFRRHGIF